MLAAAYRDVTVDVAGTIYGGQFVTQGDEVIVFYGGAVCARQPFSLDVTAVSIARQAIRAEVSRRVEATLLESDS